MAVRPQSSCAFLFLFFFFNDTATTEIYTLSLHDALPISRPDRRSADPSRRSTAGAGPALHRSPRARSEEHTSELQSRENLVCRLLLEKKKKKKINKTTHKKKKKIKKKRKTNNTN